jgi:hypothetical protein
MWYYVIRILVTRTLTRGYTYIVPTYLHNIYAVLCNPDPPRVCIYIILNYVRTYILSVRLQKCEEKRTVQSKTKTKKLIKSKVAELQLLK